MKLTEKEKEEILKGWVEAMTKIIERLEEENRKLKEVGKSLESAIGDAVRENRRLEEENKKLNEKIELLDNENMCLNAEIKDREEENKKLKEEVEQLKNQRIFNSTEYDLITLTSTTPQWELRRK